MTESKDLALTTYQLLVNATGAHFEEEELAVSILEELIDNVKSPKNIEDEYPYINAWDEVISDFKCHQCGTEDKSKQLGTKSICDECWEPRM